MLSRVVQGDLEGSEQQGIVQFLGIPYAAAPTGTRRFRPPEPADPWKGVRSATAYGPIAPQADFMSAFLGVEPEPQDESCLYLNVYTPGVDDRRRPVMVWIHGGAFMMGSGSAPGYEGASLAMRGDVVVVSINYRLGALGFLHLGEIDPSYDRSGNLGILDQIAALEWVRDNIAAFGGDPDNVTIFGESAGGMSVGTLLGTPAARGLFHKAVPESGAAHNVSPLGHAAEVTELLLGHGGTTFDALRSMPASAIVDLQQELSLKFFTDLDGQIGGGASMRLPFQPVQDGVVLASPAIDNVAQGNAAGIPVLVGTNRDEWRLFEFLDQSEVDDDKLLQRMNKVFDDGAAAVEVYRNQFPGDNPKSLFGAAVTDLVFRQPGIRLAEALIKHGSPTYSYLFTYEGMMGACHALEVPFVFGNTDAAGLGMLLGADPPQAMIDVMQESWLAFAKTGDPSNDLVGEWPVYDTERRATMELNVEPRVLDDPERERRELWSSALP